MAIGLVAPRTPAADHQRALELLRYLTVDDITPRDVPIHEPDSPSISTQLRPYCELVALRCRAPRVMLNVMDQNVMYFLSESALKENEEDTMEDPVLRACSAAVPLEGRVCEMVIGMSTTSDLAPTFVVPDLTQSRFSQLDAVTNPPYFRFYAGTPITTRDGVTIGSLAFMDTRARDGMTAAEEKCLTRTAALAMKQLEAHRQAIEGRRSMRLARALELFLAGKSAPHQRPQSQPATRSRTYGLSRSSSQVGKSPAAPIHIFVRRQSIAPPEDTDEETASDDPEGQSATAVEEASNPIGIFSRAAGLMCRGFACCDEDDLVLFVALRPRSSIPSAQVQILSGATLSRSFSNESDAPKFTLQNDVLAGLVHYYQSGCIFVLDEIQISSDEDAEDAVERSTKRSRKARELQAMKEAFPHAKQVLFCPIWDSSIGAFSQAVFVSNSAQYVSLSPTIELSFLNSFCNSVAAERTRIDVLKADKQKSDFVGTISHEMRSPLHGILASAEFLTDTQLSNYQQTLIDTVQSCGRTLLDTIDHVLDFAKISTFRKNWQMDNKRTRGINGRKRRTSQDAAPASALPALLQLTSVVNIGVVVEEVVESVVLGQNFTSNIDITDTSRQSRGRGSNAAVLSPQVDVSIEIQPADWAFITQAGAIRRIVLNLVGNALKYTAKGEVVVRMDLTGADLQTMSLTVADTGQGISRKFLNSLLYVPFAQENALAPGTGLGLSIVNNIVTMLGGTIDIDSTVGEGTTVRVVLPLQRPLPGQMSTTTTPQSGSTVSSSMSQNDSLPWLQTQSGPLQAIVYKSSRHVSLSRYLGQWYGFGLTENVNNAHVILTEEPNLDELLTMLGDNPLDHAVAIIVLCSVAEKHEASNTVIARSFINGIIEWLPTPVGPYKLAKAIRNALQSELLPRRASLSGLAPISEWTSPTTPRPGTFQNGHEEGYEIASNLCEMDLNRTGTNDPAQVVQATENMAVSQTSQHGQQAIHSPEQSEKHSERKPESFPFPEQDPNTASAPVIANGSIETRARDHPDRLASYISPTVLVVDDNMINSSLLKTFLTKKRKYTQVDCAGNGQEAVDRFTASDVSYDIVFMDISMPIMDGFEATRVIREYEQRSPNQDANGAMIVALTGLSSVRDQAEGFEVGMDIYLTKPVSFKAVGQLLDNWELHRKIGGHITNGDGPKRGKGELSRMGSGSVTAA